MKTKNYIEKTNTQIRKWYLMICLMLIMIYGVKAQVPCVQLTCPANINVSTDPALCTAVVNYATPTAVDNCCVLPTSLPGYSYLGSFEGHSYFLSSAALTWTDAKDSAEAVGGKLVSINSAAENAFLLSAAGGNFFMAGGFQNHSSPDYSEPSGGWEWVDGTPFTFTNWAGGEPNDAGGEDYLEFYGNTGEWNDLPVFAEAYVVEFTCDISPVLVSGLPSGSVFPSGTTTITYEATGAGNTSGTCSFDVIVTDNENPVITCAGNINVNNTPGLCSAIVNYAVPGAADNCAGAFVTQTTGLTSGSIFPIGTTTNTFLATDASGNTATCSFDVIVADNEAPEFFCQSTITVNADPGLCTAVVNYATPTVVDNCCTLPTSLPGYNYLGSFNGHTYFLSTTALNWTDAKDAAIAAGGKLVSINSAAENAFLLSAANGNFFLAGGFQNHSSPDYSEPSGGWEWVDGTPFSFTSWAGGEPNDAGGEDYIEFYGNTGEWNDLPLFEEAYVVEFSCDITPSLVSGLASGSAFPAGTNTVTWEASDANGNLASCTFNVIVNDDQAPVPDVENLPDLTGEVSVTATAPIALDNCSGIITGTTSDPLIYTVQGTYVIHWTYIDGSGNSSSQNQTVIIQDVTAPVPDNASLPDLTGECEVTATAPTALDNAFGIITGITSDPLTYSAQGTYVIHWIYNDGNGNSSTQNQAVIVQDVTAPVPNVSVLPNVTGQCSATATAPTALDNCSSNISGTTSDPLTYTAQGTYIIHWTYNDGNGNSSTQDQTVIVHDVTAPVPNAVVLPNVTGQCSATAPAPTALDNCSGNITGTTSDPLAYSAQGTYIIHWTYNDGNGNSSTQNQTVIVHDITAPVPNVAVLPNVTGQCSATATVPTALDNCTGIVNGVTSNPVTYNAEGTYTIHWTYNDGNGNSSTQNQTVIIDDVTNPVISGCPGNITSCSSVVTWTPPTATDNCSSVTLTSNYNPGYSFPLGNTVVTYTANDGRGNIVTCSFTVTRTSSSNLPLPVTASATTVCSGSQVTLTASGALSYSWNNGVINGVPFVPPVGNTTYTVVGSLAGGCTRTGTITVTVNALPAVPGGCDAYKCGSGKVKLTATTSSGITVDWYASATGGSPLATGTLNYTTPAISTTTTYYAQARKTATGCVSASRKALVAYVSTGIPATPGSITGQVYGLCNVTNKIYSIAPVSGALYYYWNVPGGTTITSGQGTTQITVNFGSSMCGGEIEVSAINACGISNDSDLDVYGLAATPGIVNGPTYGVCLKNGQVYSIAGVIGATNYTWTVPYGVSIVGTNSTTYTTTSTSITINFGSSFSGSGNICVKANNSCGSTSSSCLQVNAKPTVPVSITGASSVCAYSTGNVYQVSPLVFGATSYTWTVPTGATITAGQGTSQITVRFGNCSGNVSVKANNACGSSSYKSKYVSINCREAAPSSVIANLNVYPNPAHHQLSVNMKSKVKADYLLQLADMTGRVVISENGIMNEGKNSFSFNIEHLPAGIYMLEVISAGESQKMKVIKE